MRWRLRRRLVYMNLDKLLRLRQRHVYKRLVMHWLLRRRLVYRNLDKLLRLR